MSEGTPQSSPTKEPRNEDHEDNDNELHGKQATRQNIKVICRIRPTNHKELSHGGVTVLTHTEKAIEVKMDDHDPLNFAFDRVFGDETTQIEMFEKSTKPLIRDIFGGYNATIFAYGQTGTGKTFTMEGDINHDEKKGIIPRSIEEIFQRIDDADDAIEFTIKVSYIEIYMEKIRDLLDNTRQKVNLQIRENSKTGIYIEDVTEEYVTSVKGVLKLMHAGAKNRSVAATGMNEGSSRSHSVFTLTLSQKHLHTQEVTTGKLVLVDLAGSEMVKKTNSSGQQLEEAKTINKSLSALGMVINALTDEKSTHVPYRDSKLTRLLQDSLGGNSKTVLIIAISPSSFNANESVSTLRFGHRAKSIENKVAVNTVRTVEMLEALLEKAELAIDKQSSFIVALKAQLDAVIAQQRAGEEGAAMQAAEEAKAMEALREMIEKLNTELTEERAYSVKITKKLQEITEISEGRKALIEDATVMLEALQKEKIQLSERIAHLIKEKAELSSQFEDYKISTSEEISKLKFLTSEQESSLVTLRAENAMLTTDNATLREKIAQNIVSPKRKQSMYSISNDSVGGVTGLIFTSPSKDTTVHTTVSSTATTGIAMVEDTIEPVSTLEEVKPEETPAPMENATTAADVQVSEPPKETVVVPEYEAKDRAFDHLCQQIASDTMQDNSNENKTNTNGMLKTMETFAMSELVPMLSPSIDLSQNEQDYEAARDALRDAFDSLLHKQHELQHKQDVLQLEKTELNKKIEQRDERIKSLESQHQDHVNHMAERTKQLNAEIEELNNQITKMKEDHNNALEELKKQHQTQLAEQQAQNAKRTGDDVDDDVSSSPSIVTRSPESLVRSPKSLRGGRLGSFYQMKKDEDEERRQSLDRILQEEEIRLEILTAEKKKKEQSDDSKKVNFADNDVVSEPTPVASSSATVAVTPSSSSASTSTPAATPVISASVPPPTPVPVPAATAMTTAPAPAPVPVAATPKSVPQQPSPPPAACCIIS